MHKIDLIKLYSQKKAIVVDDYPDMRATVRRMLRSFGVESIDLATDGNEALARCRQNEYDIIICDYNLGEGRNGQQVLEELRFHGRLKSSSVFIMVTAETSSAIVFSALEYQPDDYLTKPFAQTLLQTRLDKIMIQKLVFAPVHEAMDLGSYDQAIQACEHIAQNHSAYILNARQWQGKALLEQGSFVAACDFYQEILNEKTLEWAQLGKSKSLMAQGKWAAAKVILQSILEQGTQNLAVYDLLAETELALGNVESAQCLLEDASGASPNAILRQMKLAEIAQVNDDDSVAEKSLRKILKLGNNSCYESPENAYSLARFLLKRHDQEHGFTESELSIESRQLVAKTRKKYATDDAMKLQGDILELRTLAAEGGAERATRGLKDIYQQFQSFEQPSAELGLELARAFASSGEGEVSKDILQFLAKAFPSDQQVLQKIDLLSDEPLTSGAKRNAARINKVGKLLFEKAEYKKAIRHFNGAVAKYPNNVAIKLNFVLAIYKQLKLSPQSLSPEMIERAEKMLVALRGMPESHSAYKRYQSLRREFERLDSAA